MNSGRFPCSGSSHGLSSIKDSRLTKLFVKRCPSTPTGCTMALLRPANGVLARTLLTDEVEVWRPNAETAPKQSVTESTDAETFMIQGSFYGNYKGTERCREQRDLCG